MNYVPLRAKTMQPLTSRHHAARVAHVWLSLRGARPFPPAVAVRRWMRRFSRCVQRASTRPLVPGQRALFLCQHWDSHIVDIKACTVLAHTGDVVTVVLSGSDGEYVRVLRRDQVRG